MDGFKDEFEFRKWQAAVALQYGIELAPLQNEPRAEAVSAWPKHPDEVRDKSKLVALPV